RSRTLPAFGRGTCPEGASDFSPTERLAEWGSGPSGPRGRGPEDRRESTVVSWLASLAPPPGLRPYSPVPLPFHGGEVLLTRSLLDFSPTERSAEWGSGPSGPRGRGPEDRHESTVVSWLASLAPPPGLRPPSPDSLPLHGAAAPFDRAP